MKLSWIGVADRLEFELLQWELDGENVGDLREEWRRKRESCSTAEDVERAAKEFYPRIERNFPADAQRASEPSSWTGIVSQCDIHADILPQFFPDEITKRIHGGWLGRSAGCLLGKPVEKTPRSGIKELLTSNSTWPIQNYITAKGMPDMLLQKYPWNKHSGKESLRENIVCMTEDDDLNYAMLNLSIVEKYGERVTTDDIAREWLSMLPSLSTFTAERVAYANLLAGIPPEKAALVMNPYREWIGAQIRADVWGWISPGQPARAAELAWRDARLTHLRNGMYAEIFFAAAISLAFVRKNIAEVIQEALRFIPPRSRLSGAIREVLDLRSKKLTWDDTVDELNNKYESYHWVHSINNASLVVAALLESQGDFERGICHVVMGGWDTDSNGATVGSLLGTMNGVDHLPSQWILPLHDRIRSSLPGFDNAALSELAARTALLAHRGIQTPDTESHQ